MGLRPRAREARAWSFAMKVVPYSANTCGQYLPKRKRKSLTSMYQVYKSELPDNIIRLFSGSNCCYDLRNSIKFEVPRFNLEVGRNSLRYRGALFWNSIPDNLKRAPSLNIFKKLLKKNRPLFDNINFNKMK